MSLSKNSVDSKNSTVSFWRKIVSAIEDLVASNMYEKINNIMSLGQVKRLRAETIACYSDLVYGKIVVDLGSGKGYSAIEILKYKPKLLILLDPSPSMLADNISYMVNNVVVERVVGVAEYMPFRNKVIEAFFSFFVLRDLLDICHAFREIARSSSGKSVLVDVIRPSSRLWDSIVLIWFCIMVPLIAGIMQGVGGYRNYSIFCKTVKRWLTKEKLAEIVRKCYGDNFVLKTRMLGVIVEVTLN